jgi:hypothetical protein
MDTGPGRLTPGRFRRPGGARAEPRQVAQDFRRRLYPLARAAGNGFQANSTFRAVG